MELLKMKNKLSVDGKNGIGFLLAGTVVWLVITILFLQSMDIKYKNLFTFYATGLMFPLAVLFSKGIKADWKSKDNPLGSLGLFLNLAQLIYFPILFWTFSSSPNDFVLLFAIITAAHFFPYGWVYNTKVYYFLSPIISVLLFIIGIVLKGQNLWIIPLTMVVSLIILNIFLFIDYKEKIKIES